MGYRVISIWTCDRCGNTKEGEVSRGEGSRPHGWREIDRNDFCPACGNDFDTFMEQGEVKRRPNEVT